MPPNKRQDTTAAAKAKQAIEKVETAVEHVAEQAAQICGRCWPAGWPHLHFAASCEHGTWQRPDPAAADPAPATDPQEPPADPSTPPDGQQPAIQTPDAQGATEQS